MKKELKSERIHIKIEPSIKEAAQKLADEEDRTLSNYIASLLKREVENKLSK